MRLCRVMTEAGPRVAFYHEEGIVLLEDAARQAGQDSGWAQQCCLVECLSGGKYHEQALGLLKVGGAKKTGKEILVPIPNPPKIFLLAGNYAEHIKEGGGMAVERAETFPYVFMKPPSTTLNDPGKPVIIPSVSPGAIDWELELGVVIGKKAKYVKETDALDYVAGYTIINDISNRKFRPNPGRKKRERDAFFDWLHGKWFDSFCPMGPCVTDISAIGNPHNLRLELKLNGQTRQDANTGQMIFSVAQLIEFISSMVTLEPGDIISTGTPSGVGNTTGTYLKPGDEMVGTIEKIGSLVTRVAEETVTQG